MILSVSLQMKLELYDTQEAFYRSILFKFHIRDRFEDLAAGELR